MVFYEEEIATISEWMEMKLGELKGCDLHVATENVS